MPLGVCDMEPTPFFCTGGKQIKSTDFYRNPWCTYYDACLNQAAREDVYLDCTRCEYKDSVLEEYALLLGRCDGPDAPSA